MITSLPILPRSRNYCHIIQQDQCAVIFDPGEALPVIYWAKQRSLDITHILITHHHWDHTNGIAEVKKHYPNAKVVTSTTSSVESDICLADGECLQIDYLQHPIRAIHIPGHTLDHVAYLYQKSVFPGDTLFSMGCGRIFEGTPELMLSSLKKIASLPEDTLIYFAHEYTETNIAFYSSIFGPAAWMAKILDSDTTMTVPSMLAFEKKHNPFLNCHQNYIQKVLNVDNELAAFTKLRKLKDDFPS